MVEISPLGLVEMTRQNVTEGPREILTRKCPTCAGDGIVFSDASAALEVERQLLSLARGSRAQAFRVEVSPRVASILVGPGAGRLTEIEEQARRRFFLEPTEGVELEHVKVLGQGKLADLAPDAPVAEGAQIQLKLDQVGKHDPLSAVGKLDGLEINVGGAAKQVGKRVKVRVERVLDGAAYATWLGAPAVDMPLTAEGEAEKPTRQPRSKKAPSEVEAQAEPTVEPAEPVLEVAEAAVAAADEDAEAVSSEEAAKPKKKTRRGSRGGRGRKRKTAAAAVADAEQGEETAPEGASEPEPTTKEAKPPEAQRSPGPKIHVPGDDFDLDDARSGNGAADGVTETPAPKKRTRRGTRGGRGRKRKPEAAEAAGVADAVETAEESQEVPAGNGQPAADWEYVPMSEWGDEVR